MPQASSDTPAASADTRTAPTPEDRLSTMLDDEGSMLPESPAAAPTARAATPAPTPPDDGSALELLEDPDEHEDEADEATEDDESPPAEEEDDTPPPAPAPAKTALAPDTVLFTIPNEDGTEEAVTLEEARRGHLRQRDYTRKRMQEAEIARQAELKRDAYAGLVEQYKQHLDKLAPQEPDWAKLRAELEPSEYLLRRDEWREIQTERQAAQEELDRLAAERTEQQQKAMLEQHQTLLSQETERLYEKLPHWKKDSKVAEREAKALQTFLQERGFTPEEQAALVDHRVVLLVRDAALYRQGRKKAPRAQAPQPGKPLPPGKPPVRGEDTGFRKARQTLRETGSVEDAAAALSRMKGLLD